MGHRAGPVEGGAGSFIVEVRLSKTLIQRSRKMGRARSHTVHRFLTLAALISVELREPLHWSKRLGEWPNRVCPISCEDRPDFSGGTRVPLPTGSITRVGV